MEAIGVRYSITRERVRQVLKASGVTAEDARQARLASREAAAATDRARVLEWLAENPGRTRATAAAALGLPEERIVAVLGEQSRRWFVSEEAPLEVYSDEELFESLRAAAELYGNPLSADSYDLFSADTGAVTSVRITQRFGTWNSACRAAGLFTNRGRPSYRRGWTEGQMLEHVADYLAQEDCPGSYAGYDRFARGTTGAPSAQTVRNAFRS